jgi:hypothetical protein
MIDVKPERSVLIVVSAIVAWGVSPHSAQAQQGYEFGVRFRQLTFQPVSFRGFSFQGQQNIRPLPQQPIQFGSITFPPFNSPPIARQRETADNQPLPIRSDTPIVDRDSRLAGRQLPSPDDERTVSNRRLLASQRNAFVGTGVRGTSAPAVAFGPLRADDSPDRRRSRLEAVSLRNARLQSSDVDVRTASRAPFANFSGNRTR